MEIISLSKEKLVSKLNKNKNEWPMFNDVEIYGECICFKEDDEIIAYCSFSNYSNELHIYTFEVANSLKRLGYGKECYKLLINLFKKQISFITLDYLNESSAAFWTTLGFKYWPEGDSEDSMILEL